MEKKLFLISNDGLHPIEPKLKRQYGKDIITKSVTVGNLLLGQKCANDIVKTTREILVAHDDYQVYLVFSGFPVYNLVIFETVQKVLNTTPIVLVYDKVTKSYIEFVIDIRQMLFDQMRSEGLKTV